jgi:hypothetical protein
MNTPTQEPCIHENMPESCYRIRCQLGKKCLNDDQSFRTSPQSREQSPLVQIASDIMGACMNGDLSDKWEDVADLLVSNNFDGLSKLTQSREPMSEDEILEAIARGWCHAKNTHKTIDIDLVSAIASEVYHAIKTRY